jgi:imidazoleglycerol-phosphate dehydratase
MKENRTSKIQRETSETDISLQFTLDGTGKYHVNTGVPFFDHLLELFAKHGKFDLVEDTGITLGDAFSEAIGKKGGIRRFASCYVPMDEALARVCIDISGRAYLSYNVEIPEPYILHFNAGLIEEFLRAFVHRAEINLHVDSIRGKNAHHIVEAVFKAFGVALHDATKVTGHREDIPSTKGVL